MDEGHIKHTVTLCKIFDMPHQATYLPVLVQTAKSSYMTVRWVIPCLSCKMLIWAAL